jgi:hypothetical protein
MELAQESHHGILAFLVKIEIMKNNCLKEV